MCCNFDSCRDCCCRHCCCNSCCCCGNDNDNDNDNVLPNVSDLEFTHDYPIYVSVPTFLRRSNGCGGNASARNTFNGNSSGCGCRR